MEPVHELRHCADSQFRHSSNAFGRGAGGTSHGIRCSARRAGDIFLAIKDMRVVQEYAFLISVRFLSGSVRGSGSRTGAGPGARAGVPREASQLEGERGELARGQRESGSRKRDVVVVVSGVLGSGGEVGNGGGERWLEEPAAAEEADRQRHGVRHVLWKQRDNKV